MQSGRSKAERTLDTIISEVRQLLLASQSNEDTDDAILDHVEYEVLALKARVHRWSLNGYAKHLEGESGEPIVIAGGKQ